MHVQPLVQKDKVLTTSRSQRISTVEEQVLHLSGNPYNLHDVQPISPGFYKILRGQLKLSTDNYPGFVHPKENYPDLYKISAKKNLEKGFCKNLSNTGSRHGVSLHE